MNYPIDQIRLKFPALQRKENGKSVIFFDGPGGTQMVDDAIEEMVAYISSGMANLHGTFDTSKETEKMIAETREAVADLLGCKSHEVAFGANMTTLAFAIARGLGSYLQKGDEVVVTELDHRANVDPWVTLAEDRDASVKFIELDPDSYTLQMEHLDKMITSNTKLVAVGLSSNVTGTVTEVEEIIERAKEVGALVVVDAVHAVPHLPIDFSALNCDILLCSAYKFFGPHVGIAVVKDTLFHELAVYKLAPAPSLPPFKLETGTQNHEGIAGVKGAIRFIEGLGEGSTRRERLQSGLERIDDYERSVACELERFLRTLPSVTLYRAPDGVRKTPTLAFTIEGEDSREVTKWLATHFQLFVADGDFYASTMANKLGVSHYNGWIRIGLAPYNTMDEIKRCMEALQEYVNKKR